jgi:hypothetical protein
MAEWNWTDGGWGNKRFGRGQRQGRRSEVTGGKTFPPVHAR